MSVQHKAQALAIHCIDWRFQAMIEADLAAKNLNGNCDRIAWPGTSKDIETITKAAETSLRLHDPDIALIYEHEDCGAYGDDNSEGTHRRNAQTLAQRLKEIKPNLEVSTLLATFEGTREL